MAIGIGIFITVGLLTVEQGYAEEKDDGPTCTLNTLKGWPKCHRSRREVCRGWSNRGHGPFFSSLLEAQQALQVLPEDFFLFFLRQAL